ncbi:MAG TPA: hypothetical protein VHM69_10900 [Rubrobacter sp.]|nr:hypothetical protein [Rubrobacter sp.]
MTRSHPGAEDREQALAYLEELQEETMRLAWGEDASAEDRRRIAVAAIIFGRQFEERVAERSADLGEDGLQRFLLDLMSGVVAEFARIEGLDENEAAGFLSEVGTRDHVLEFDEVLDAYEGGEPGRTLDELLQDAVNSRREKAARSRRHGPF